MKKTSLTRALLVAGVMAVAGGMAQADAIFYPDGTHVNLGENAVENGLADAVLARSPSTAPDRSVLASLGVSADQSQIFAFNPTADDTSIDTAMAVDTPSTTVLGAGPARATTTTVATTTPVYVFPNIDWDRATVLSQPHPMMSHLRDMPADNFERSAAASFDSPTRAGEASTMTSGAPNLVSDNEVVANVPPPLAPDTTALGAGPATIVDPNTGSQNMVNPGTSCDSSTGFCQYLRD